MKKQYLFHTDLYAYVRANFLYYAMGLFFVLAGCFCGIGLKGYLPQGMAVLPAASFADGVLRLYRKSYMYCFAGVCAFWVPGVLLILLLKIGETAFSFVGWQCIWQQGDFLMNLMYRGLYSLRMGIDSLLLGRMIRYIVLYYIKRRGKKRRLIIGSVSQRRQEILQFLWGLRINYVCYLLLWCTELLLWEAWV